MGDTFQEIEDGVNLFVRLASMLSGLIPGLSFLTPYISLFPTLIQAVNTVKGSVPGQSTTSAVSAVQAHLTPGQPNAQVLAPDTSAG